MSGAFLTREINAIEAADSGEHLNDFADLVACVAHRLEGGRSQSCRAVRYSRNMGKFIIEFEIETEDRADADLRRLIGKVYKGDRGQGHFDALSRLREAGFRPPSPFTVVYPVAYIADRQLLLQEKAPGSLLADLIFGEPDAAAFGALDRAAGWLAALHGAEVNAQPRLERVRMLVARQGRELMELLPQQAYRVERLAARALAGLEARHLTPLVPSHGDFHPKNVFITADGRVTVIDFDTFGLQEQAADVAYILAQTAIMGYRRRGSFAATAQARHCFIQAYLEAAPMLSGQRLALYQGMAFLQSLHYELCTLRNGRTAIIEPWLTNAERCLLDEELTLIEDSECGIDELDGGGVTAMHFQIETARRVNDSTIIHPTAEVSEEATIGQGCRIWHQAQVRERARIGRNCTLGKGVYVDFDVVIGDHVKIENGCFLYHGARLEDGVFFGPGVILTNDKLPRAINPDGSLKNGADWEVGKILVKRGASLGAGAVVLPDLVIGAFAMVGSGTVVTKDVPDHGLVVGNPARLVGFVCYCGARLREGRQGRDEMKISCSRCGMPAPALIQQSRLVEVVGAIDSSYRRGEKSGSLKRREIQ
jgi:UDP-2-acetamido-3-amino-2,3-dideoxy-glucuronate N-acetyltransferase